MNEQNETNMSPVDISKDWHQKDELVDWHASKLHAASQQG